MSRRLPSLVHSAWGPGCDQFARSLRAVAVALLFLAPATVAADIAAVGIDGPATVCLGATITLTPTISQSGYLGTQKCAVQVLLLRKPERPATWPWTSLPIPPPLPVGSFHVQTEFGLAIACLEAGSCSPMTVDWTVANGFDVIPPGDYWWGLAVFAPSSPNDSFLENNFLVGDPVSVCQMPSPPMFAEEMKLTAPDAASFDSFGTSVAMSGETAIVGVPDDDHAAGSNAGSAWIFVRTGSTWSAQTKLTASDAAQNDRFGSTVALAADTAVVAAVDDDNPAGTVGGSVYVFVRSGTTWSQQAKLTAAGSGGLFGAAAAIRGNTLIVGAAEEDHSGFSRPGAAYVFVRSNLNWTQQAKLIASDPANGEDFGSAVAIWGNTVIVGSEDDDTAAGLAAGSAYVFTRSGSAWSQQAKLLASDAASQDEFGCAVTLAGDTAVIGARDVVQGGVPNAGAAYVFLRSGSAWNEATRLTVAEPMSLDGFGNALSLAGGRLVVGSVAANAAHVFVGGAADWIHCAKLTTTDAALPDATGFSVAQSGNACIVGAPYDTHSGLSDAGSAYSLRSEGDWSDLGFALAGVNGEPYLAGTGELTVGSMGALNLTRAAATSFAMLFVSFGSSPVPFKCGTLVAFPYASHLLALTNGSGSVAAAWSSWPGGLSGINLYLQYAIHDTAAPCGVALSNAIHANVP